MFGYLLPSLTRLEVWILFVVRQHQTKSPRLREMSRYFDWEEMADEMSDQEREFKRFMLPRLFGLVAAVDRPKDESETFPMCSGVIVETRGYFVLVTVAHFLKDLMKWKEGHRLLDVQLIIHDESGFCGLIELDLDKNEVFHNELIDIGFIILESNVLDKIERHKGKAVRADTEAASPDNLPERFILVGHSSAHAKVNTSIISSAETAGTETIWQSVRLSGLAVAFVVLQLDGNGDDLQTFKFSPVRGIDDYSGTSGGPIFGYKEGGAIRDYCLFVSVRVGHVVPGRC